VDRTLLRSLAPRLKELDKGGYSRTWRRGGRAYRDSLHRSVSEILESLGIEYKETVAVGRGSSTVADFLVGSKAVFVGRDVSQEVVRELSRAGLGCVLITTDTMRSDDLDEGIRVVELGGPKRGRLQTIFMDDPSFNFDYAHILPMTEKCSVMHGHTSSALVEIIGSTRDGMVVDFNEAKPIIKGAISALDHKLFINQKYVVREDRTHVDLRFETAHGEFALHVPKETTVLLDGEATVENLADELLRRIAPKMPANVEAVGVYVYEGLNKGTHLLAQVHAKEARKARKR